MQFQSGYELHSSMLKIANTFDRNNIIKLKWQLQLNLKCNNSILVIGSEKEFWIALIVDTWNVVNTMYFSNL